MREFNIEGVTIHGGDTVKAEITVVTARFGPVFDRGLTACLNEERDIVVLQYALDLSELEAAIARESPRVAILGEAAFASSFVPRRLKAVQPNIGLVVLLPGVSERQGRQLMAFGITACVAQEAAWSDISAAVRFAAEGKQVFVPAASGGQSRGRESKVLTRREWEVLQLVQAGRSNPEIASALQIGLEFLVTQVRGSGTEVPAELTDTEWLTPWAADLRYDEPTALDRGAAVALAESAVHWSGSLLDPDE